MKARPKVFNRDSGWWIDLPPFGFGRNCPAGRGTGMSSGEKPRVVDAP